MSKMHYFSNEFSKIALSAFRCQRPFNFRLWRPEVA